MHQIGYFLKFARTPIQISRFPMTRMFSYFQNPSAVMYILVSVSAFTAIRAAVAQISELPSCSHKCVKNALSAIGCPSNDIVCLCTDPSLLTIILQCSALTCSVDDQETVNSDLDLLCDANITSSGLSGATLTTTLLNGATVTREIPGLSATLKPIANASAVRSSLITASATSKVNPIQNATMPVTNSTSTAANVVSSAKTAVNATRSSTASSNSAGSSLLASRHAGVLGLILIVIRSVVFLV
ncbi:hypothetical protein GGU10DRAFT_367005 [Lentinula aff. detonsa]|uniref:CFEM domain-containing protein n=1 Tax=Lentinula aff. detonsa TaxID=2804958 RepID=A0AA38KC92_9AGAR|nr:hypothetical protein GGU10DRAFT_367005 [Lentinula aff. detonsa]